MLALGKRNPNILLAESRAVLHLRAIRFEDELDIFVTVSRLGTKSVSYLHRMFLGGHAIATGKIVAVCSMVDPELGVLTGIRIPEHLRELLSEYLAQPK